MEKIFKKLKEYMKELEDKKFINHLLIILIITVVLLFLTKNLSKPKSNIEPSVLNEDKIEYNNEVNDFTKYTREKTI